MTGRRRGLVGGRPRVAVARACAEGVWLLRPRGEATLEAYLPAVDQPDVEGHLAAVNLCGGALEGRCVPPQADGLVAHNHVRMLHRLRQVGEYHDQIVLRRCNQRRPGAARRHVAWHVVERHREDSRLRPRDLVEGFNLAVKVVVGTGVHDLNDGFARAVAIIPVVIHPIVLGITVAYPIIQRLSFCNSMLRKRCTTFSSSNVYHRVTLILS